jgi:hypothetical protein
MGVPTNRTPVRIARGATSALNAGLTAIQEGEIVFDNTLNRLQVKEGGTLVSSQAVLPATNAVTDTAQTFTALQTMNAGIAIDGPYKQTAEAVSALDIDLSTGNYFTKTISGNSTFTFTNPPATGTVGSFTLELTHSSGTVAWPDGTGAAGIVRWPADTPPTLTAGKTHIFVFVTDDGSVSSGTGPTYRGAALADYVN